MGGGAPNACRLYMFVYIMTSANVLPSAPDYAETEQQLYPMNEIKEINAEDFRLKKISDLQTELTNEAKHYRRQVAKKIYKRSHPLFTPRQLALVHFLQCFRLQPWQQP